MPAAGARPTVATHWKHWILAVSGELDLATAPGLDARLTQLIGSGSQTGLLLDLSRVTFIDCAGLAPLLRAQRRLGNRLYLRNPNRAVLRIVDLLGLTDVFQVVQPGTSWPDPTEPTEVVVRSHDLRRPLTR